MQEMEVKGEFSLAKEEHKLLPSHPIKDVIVFHISSVRILARW
jgi:hypothetical protein